MVGLPFGDAGDSDIYRKLLAQQLMGGVGDTSPVQHWSQGANRMAQAALLGMLANKDQREKSDYDKELVKMLGGVPPTPQTSIASIGQPSPTTQAAGKIYEANEPSPLDPPAGNERDQMIRLLHAEAGNQSPQGQQAVANVIRNRAVEGNYGGDTATGVMNKPWAFEPTMTPQGRQRMASLDPNSAQYQNLSSAVDRAYTGDDPTKGATHFYSPNAQASLGRPPPAWGQGPGQDIGQHRFFGGAGGQPVQMAQASIPGQPPMPPQQSDQRAQIMQMMQSQNPRIRELGRGLIQQQIQQQFKPTEWDIKTRDDGTIIAVNKRDPRVNQVIQAQGAAQSAVSHAAAREGATTSAKIMAERGTKDALPPTYEDVSKLRKEVQDLPSYKNVAQAAPVYKSMVDAAGRDTRAADVNLIYGMAKIMDPGSVVRESEMSVAQAIATIPQHLRATVESQLMSTGRLSPEVREALMQEAHSRMQSYAGMFEQDAGMYRGIAGRNRMLEEDVLPRFGPFEQYKKPEKPPAPTLAPREGATATNPQTGEKIIFRNNRWVPAR